ncbi:unannotated protein [freshwater metagenome]|uniref:Unannotated protein n=1 Tax=freshwater metagenome TaxID=449393 RepID=A0A6J6H7R3_9ZZZZ
MVDEYGAVVDKTIIAGVIVQQNGAPSSSDSCQWSPSLVRDSGQGAGDEVTKRVGSVSFRLYDRVCEGEATTYYWIPEISTEQIARSAASVVYDLIPAPFGEFAPPARQGLINIGTWFWVEPTVWQPKSVTAWVPTPEGPVSVTTTATPTKLVFHPGDGFRGMGDKTCTGPGQKWIDMMGDSLPSTCMYSYRHSSAVNSSGLFSASLSIIWRVAWRSSTGASGTLPNVSTGSSHQMNIREFQALVTS